MEKGHLRCDANISLRPAGDDKFYPKTEVKNLNSFRAVERALAYEVDRQTVLWEKGTPPDKGSTRGWDEKKGETVAQREKEAVHDYRYFPEPDIPPLEISQQQIDEWRASLPELPAFRRKHYRENWQLTPKVAEFLLENQVVGTFAEQVVDEVLPQVEGDAAAAAKLATNWIVNKYPSVLETVKQKFDSVPIVASRFADFLKAVAAGKVNSTNAQVLLKRMVETGRDPQTILAEEDLAQGEGEELAGVVARALENYPEQAEQLKAGKVVLSKFFVGVVMKETKGKVDPMGVESELKRQLGL
jgi:aspartyl-tRNA(Asn)/glutamyl-tRNA(Gln) amidotransferase subunit B